MPTGQREAIEGIIRDYLLHNPDVLIEALHGAEDKLNREADAKAVKVLSDQRREIFDDPDGRPRDRQPIHVERRGEQRAVAKKHEMSARCIERKRPRFNDDGSLSVDE